MATLLSSMADAGGDVIGLDWRIPLDRGWAEVGEDRGVQGNLDPAVLFSPQEHIRETTRGILGQLGGVGHILNLGHGILPATPVENAQMFITTGQQFSFTEKLAAK